VSQVYLYEVKSRLLHALTAGSDLRVWWAALVLWGCAAATGTAVIARLLAWRPRRGRRLPDQASLPDRVLG